MNNAERRRLPLVYSCSGCSNVAQLANRVAVLLDRGGQAEMSCIVGVGGDVASLVRVAQSERPMLVLDGCQLACASRCLERQGVTPTVHLTLTELGLRKRAHEDFTAAEVDAMLEVAAAALASMSEPAAPASREGTP